LENSDSDRHALELFQQLSEEKFESLSVDALGLSIFLGF
jgi:hypothetical protein